MDFNEIWYQQSSCIGVDYALHLISKYLRAMKVLEGVNFFTKYLLYFISNSLHTLGYFH